MNIVMYGRFKRLVYIFTMKWSIVLIKHNYSVIIILLFLIIIIISILSCTVKKSYVYTTVLRAKFFIFVFESYALCNLETPLDLYLLLYNRHSVFLIILCSIFFFYL